MSRPYFNALDALVFPSLSSRLSEVLAEEGSGCAKMDAIWEALYPVWLELPSYIVAKAFLLVLHTCKLVIKSNGGNKWLKKGAIHCGIRDMYDVAQYGMERKAEPRNSMKRTIDHLSRDMLD